MPLPIRLKINSLVAKLESTYSTDPTPTGAANAILLRKEPTFTPMEMVTEERDMLAPYFGNSDLLIGAVYGKIELEVEAASSGTAGTAPPWAPLALGCGTSETLNAAPVANTAQAGGSTTTIKLAAAASATDDFYTGLPISITAGTGNGQSGFIVDYDGTSKIATVASAAWVAPDATSTYSIGAGAVYRPVTNNPSSVGLYWYIDGIAYKYLGLRGNMKYEIAADKTPFFTFSFQGIYVPVSDASVPASAYTGWQKPLMANKANTPLFVLHGMPALGLEKLSLDLGNEIARHALINNNEQHIITDRKSRGDLGIEATTVATKDWFAAVKSGTLGSLALQHGTVAGNKLAVMAPSVQLTGINQANRNNIAMFNMGWRPKPVSGNDDFAFCAF